MFIKINEKWRLNLAFLLSKPQLLKGSTHITVAMLLKNEWALQFADANINIQQY